MRYEALRQGFRIGCPDSPFIQSPDFDLHQTCIGAAVYIHYMNDHQEAASADTGQAMKKEPVSGSPYDPTSLLALLKRERDVLKLKIHLARCGIQKEWGNAEAKWQLLNGSNIQDHTWRAAEELKQSYIQICRGLLAKNCKLLDQLNRIRQKDKTASLQDLKRQVASEISALRLSLETLGGVESISFRPEEELVCACLKCQQAVGAQPFNVDEILAAARSP